MNLSRGGYGGEYVIEWAKEMPAGLAWRKLLPGVGVAKNDQQDTLRSWAFF
ncbi:MAG: hypothetical protein Ct9H90mP5_05020 [Acidimicrobiaceae bacterium]|nr:MAG: hypothetical protein Ct9H90mP5_05020 [Acidimicrobiaceae bacterium]